MQELQREVDELQRVLRLGPQQHSDITGSSMFAPEVAEADGSLDNASGVGAVYEGTAAGPPTSTATSILDVLKQAKDRR